MKWIKKYPRAICVWVGPRPVLITCHPETCKLVMKSSEPKHLHDKGAYSFVRPWMGESSKDSMFCKTSRPLGYERVYL